MFLCNIALTASDLASITSHIHSWLLFLLWLHPFILSSYFSTDLQQHIGHLLTWAFIFQCTIFLPLYTVHEVLKARILKWFSIPFSWLVDHKYMLNKIRLAKCEFVNNYLHNIILSFFKTEHGSLVVQKISMSEKK